MKVLGRTACRTVLVHSCHCNGQGWGKVKCQDCFGVFTLSLKMNSNMNTLSGAFGVHGEDSNQMMVHTVTRFVFLHVPSHIT